ncbi:GDSL esterase/lipase At4g10955-like [Phragmites australis]|uniref:GDSL esterase/lipase At4g10955-like n=1 Tax=Phragmites australis TaxID=29695 RepID=UPI002D795BD6|nr:GDSL esterase/lipase At4g10955-like [Phragmites australis]
MAMAQHASLSCSTTWRELTSTSWRDNDYRRMVMACLIEAVYLLELERQERRDAAAVAQQWWKPFQYRLAHELVDDRDGSVFGAIFERDHHLLDGDRPSGAPSAVIAFRGTLLRAPTIRRDVEDELRLVAWNSLRGSARLARAMQALRATIDQFGSENVCVCGHSLGAGFARQVGRMLMASPRRQPQQQAALEFHLFNAPYLSLPMGVSSVVKTAGCLLKALRSGVGRWHGKALRNVAYANCILGYTRLESCRRL